jgi:NADP-dependent alcohol dehydrogenase
VEPYIEDIMETFTYHNPTRIEFGRKTIAKLDDLLPRDRKIMVLYGGGSIKRNGVYDQVRSALGARPVVEFGGIEPNPRYETCMKAVSALRAGGARFLLAVGGGSVFDACKLVAAAALWKSGDPWDILAKGVPVREAMPWGGVLTLPATGSEMNANSVISRDSTKEKLAFAADAVRPVFSILDPETTYTLDARQTANGVVDAFVHVAEQYLTYPAAAPLQDRQAEAVLLTLVEYGPKVLAAPRDYDLRAAIMWCATNALNGLIGCGVPGDWATHSIGHELTALYGIDHAQSLAVVLPGVLSNQLARKREKIVQMGERVFGIAKGDADARARAAIEATERFFRSLGVGTTLKDYRIPAEACDLVATRLETRGTTKLGEHGAIGPREVSEILRLRAGA